MTLKPLQDTVSNNDDKRKGGRLAEVIPLYGRDEMNLLEFPLGPISQGDENSFQIEHECIDQETKRPVIRTLLVTGSDAHGLPKPIDDQVLLAMKALTAESSFADRRVYFSQYQLCKSIGWEPSGRSYERLEQSLDRLAATTLKFKNSWWDRGEKEWRSHTFHLIDNLELSSRGRYSKHRSQTGRREQALCYFVWNETVWKSFSDGYIKKVDMEMFRAISRGRRREVPLRLFRWLDKQFYRRRTVKIEVRKLCYGTLGLRETYPSELRRILDRAAGVLIDHRFLGEFEFQGNSIIFRKDVRMRPRTLTSPAPRVNLSSDNPGSNRPLSFATIQHEFPKFDLVAKEIQLLNSDFGSELERSHVAREIQNEIGLENAGPIRLHLLHRFLTQAALSKANEIANR